MSLNRATIIGNLGSSPDLKHTQSGTAVCTLSIATNRKWKDKDDKEHEEVEWHRVVVWGKQAENCAKYLGKGKQVYVEGRLRTQKWEDDKNIERWTTEIVASRVQFLGKGEGSKRQPAPSQFEDSYVPTDPGPDDIPF